MLLQITPRYEVNEKEREKEEKRRTVQYLHIFWPQICPRLCRHISGRSKRQQGRGNFGGLLGEEGKREREALEADEALRLGIAALSASSQRVQQDGISPHLG